MNASDTNRDPIRFDDSVICQLIKMTDTARVLVGIYGPPGSGKSTFASSLAEYLNGSHASDFAVAVPMDGFHLSNSALSSIGLLDKKGAPETFDVEGFVALLQRIREQQSETIYAPTYSRTINEPIAASIIVPPSAQVIIAEGNYLGYSIDGWARVCECFDELWYIDESTSILADRLIARQMAGGKSRAEAERWFESVDNPNIELVASTAAVADRVFLPYTQHRSYKFA